ncbi:MAG: OmpA family protein [Betaproteobacteria bacterium]|nr:OmpA family protein [Betaproteobacteria bacterium]
MLKECLMVSLIAAALGGATVRAADYVSASGMPLKSGFGECVRTGYWSEASEPCETPVVQLAMDDTPRMPPAISWHSVAVGFAFDGDQLDDAARADLDTLLARFEPDEVERVSISAHADRIGARQYNFSLSERRLEAVRNYLATKGVTLPMLDAEARGAEEPVTKCAELGPEKKDNAALVACLAPDRRVQIGVKGAPRELARTAKRADW